jgi:general secretion pathway protein E
MYNRQRIGEILVQRGKVTTDQVQRALKLQVEKASRTGERLRVGEILIDMDACDEVDVAAAIAHQLDYPMVESIAADELDLTLLADLNLSFCRENLILPLGRSPRYVEVGTNDPLDVDVLDEVRLLLGAEVLPVMVPSKVLTEAVNAAFDRKAREIGAAIRDFESDEESPVTGDAEVNALDLIEAADDDEAPVIQFVNSLFIQSVRERASDIHIEPGEKEIRVRFRIDGILKEVAATPKRFHSSIITRIKIMADLNIAEKRVPQDGRIRIKMAGKDIDIRVATAPSAHGERVTMRLLDKSAMLLDVRTIGFAPDQLKTILSMINRPHGIILVTGPTGSGKTTTLYSCLSEINSPDKNILTIEDPVEYQLEGISQMQTNAKIDLTFASGLRSYLRHDPDVIMVGEIRDAETAEMAIQASLTGHLVFSTLHTNDAAGAFARLTDMGVEPFLVASTVILTMAQRLVRRLCPDCKEPYRPTSEELEELGLTQHDIDFQTERGFIYKPREGGCDTCVGLGYKGRAGIYELLEVKDSVRRLVMNRADSGTIKREASTAHKMRSLREDGALKVLTGKTSIEEVLRVTSEGLEDAAGLSDAS